MFISVPGGLSPILLLPIGYVQFPVIRSEVVIFGKLLTISGDTVTFGIRFLSANVCSVLSYSVPALSL